MAIRRFALLLIAVLLAACGKAQDVPQIPSLEGRWIAVWYEGYGQEVLTIRSVEAVSQKYELELDYVRTSDVGGPYSMNHSAVLVDNALLLDRAYDFFGSKYAVLAIEYEDQDVILVPYPNPGSMMNAGDTRAVYRRDTD